MKALLAVPSFIAALALAASGCGDELLSDLKSFEENTAPVITSFSSDLDEDTERMPNMLVNLAVEARDVEGGTIEYEFTSDYGTFRRLRRTSSGCDIEFFIGAESPTSESIVLTVTAADSKGAASSRALDIGDGRAGPAVSGAWPSDTSLGAAETRPVTFTADCTGYYQVRAQNPPAETISFDGAGKSFFYDRGAGVTFLVGGSGSTVDADKDIMLDTAGTHKVYVIVRDNFMREGSASAVFTAE